MSTGVAGSVAGSAAGSAKHQLGEFFIAELVLALPANSFIAELVLTLPASVSVFHSVLWIAPFAELRYTVSFHLH